MNWKCLRLFQEIEGEIEYLIKRLQGQSLILRRCNVALEINLETFSFRVSRRYQTLQPFTLHLIKVVLMCVAAYLFLPVKVVPMALIQTLNQNHQKGKFTRVLKSRCKRI